MKTAIVFADGIKQIIFTPENDDERQALKLITADDNIELAIKQGSFGDSCHKPFTVHLEVSRGGYLHTYSDQESVMLVLSPKKKSEKTHTEDSSFIRSCIENNVANKPSWTIVGTLPSMGGFSPIGSVKRNSDGETFSVGDEIQTRYFYSSPLGSPSENSNQNTFATIESFKIDGDDMIIHLKDQPKAVSTVLLENTTLVK